VREALGDLGIAQVGHGRGEASTGRSGDV
jgi:hypothetical protein